MHTRAEEWLRRGPPKHPQDAAGRAADAPDSHRKNSLRKIRSKGWVVRAPFIDG